jgi:hypothetical protein
VVLDIDPRHGGNASLAVLEEMHGPLPKTPTVETGGDGRHYYFRYPSGHKVKSSTLRAAGTGLDVKADAGGVVAPPSRHETGQLYFWAAGASPDDVPLADLPPWLLAVVTDQHSSDARSDEIAVGGAIPQGRRHETLVSLAGTMRRRGMSPAAMEAALLAENQARCNPPLGEREVCSIAASILKYPTGRTDSNYGTNSNGQDRLAEACIRGITSAQGPPRVWPSLDPTALHGIAGEVVRAIEPHSESDPAALLLQLLVAMGNACGRLPHFVAESDRHGCNLFVVLVGETSKGRKGTSYGHVRRLVERADSSWPGDRSGLVSGEGLIYNVRDAVSEFTKGKDTLVDPGVDDKRLLVVEPEFAAILRGAMARQGNTLSAILDWPGTVGTWRRWRRTPTRKLMAPTSRSSLM